MKLDGRQGTVLLENPVGCQLFESAGDMQQKIAAIYAVSKKLSSSEGKLQPVTFSGDLDAFHGKTLYLL